MVILLNTEKENAKASAERMRAAISKHMFPEIEGTITVSIGISGLPDPALAKEDRLVRCADFALCRAKQNGRNRIEHSAGKDLEKAS